MGHRFGVTRATEPGQQPPNEPGPNTASETDGGKFDDTEYSTEGIYSGSNQESDSGDKEDMRGVKRRRARGKSSIREAQAAAVSQYIIFFT